MAWRISAHQRSVARQRHVLFVFLALALGRISTLPPGEWQMGERTPNMKKMLVVGGVIVTVVVGGFLALLVLASLEEQSEHSGY